MEPVTFIEVNTETGRKVQHGKVKYVKNYTALSVDDAMNALRTRKHDFSFYKIKGLDTYNVYFALSKEKIPEIFVMKRYKRKDSSFNMEHNAFTKVQEMDDLCRSFLISGKAISKRDTYWILMEYFDGSLIELERKLTEKERRSILKKIAKAVKCLREKGLYYTDMKLDQVLYRIHDDDSLEVKLADLEVSREGRGTLVTYHAPTKSPFVSRDGHFKYGATDEAVNWGIVILILHLWTKDDSTLYRAFKKYHKEHKKMVSALRGKIPDDIWYLIDELYVKWDQISTDDLFKSLRV